MTRFFLMPLLAAAIVAPTANPVLAQDTSATGQTQPASPESAPTQSFPPGRMPGLYVTPPFRTKDQIEAEERRKNQSGGCKYFPGKLDLIV